MTILISNKTIINDLKKLIIHEKAYLSDVGEFSYVFGGKVMEENDTPLIDRGISKNNCLTVINGNNNDEMKEIIEEINEDVVDFDVPVSERGNVEADSKISTSYSNQSSNEDDDDDQVPGKCFFFISNSCQMCTHSIMCTDILLIYFS